jgi:hypothetical protein
MKTIRSAPSIAALYLNIFVVEVKSALVPSLYRWMRELFLL